jgi:hypothetical protein
MGLFSLRGTFREIYVLHDASRSEEERVQAAFTLAHDPRRTPQQAWEMALRKSLPPLARYLLAESLDVDVVAADPRAYVNAVARSPGWPSWLRLLLLRPIAYAAGHGYRLPVEPLDSLTRDADPIIALWASFVRCAEAQGQGSADRADRLALERVAASNTPNRELARLLLDALEVRGSPRDRLLDQANAWIRSHHAEARRLWEGWEIRGDRIVRTARVGLPSS